MNTALKILKRQTDHEDTSVWCENETDYYGTSFILNKFRNHLVPCPISSKTFKHGWTPNRTVRHPNQILHWGEKNDFHICFNEFQKKCLETNGYTHVTPAGAPFLYADELIKGRDIPKKKNSLLIMPAHTLAHVGGRTFFKEFFESCVLERNYLNSKDSTACIHQESKCEETSAFLSANNFKIVKGAKYDDSLSLIKQVVLMRSSDYMLTNTMGSHILYALYSGCKVKIINENKPQLEELLKHEWYRQNVEVAKANVDTNNQIHELYPEFFKGWINPSEIQALINDEIGLESFQNILNTSAFDNLFLKKSWPVMKWNLKNHRSFVNFKNHLKKFEQNVQ